MIRKDNNFHTKQIRTKFLKSKHNSIQFFLSGGVISLCMVKSSRRIAYYMGCSSCSWLKTAPTALSLASHINSKGSAQFEGCTIGLVVNFIFNTSNAFIQHPYQADCIRRSNFRKVFDKSTVKSNMSSKGSDFSNSLGVRQRLKNINFCFVYL